MKNQNNSLEKLSKILLIFASVALLISIFIPIWRIELDAPQYPEGLKLLIFSNKLAGDLDIINGLNHYIGMKTLHVEDFVEFTVLPYIIGFFAIFSLAAVFLNRKKWLFTLFGLFVVFGILAMIDFWKWEYNYGHNLNPNAAIIVPGMAYQPPLIGFKQLLNFGAYSIPDMGGWLFILSGVAMLTAVLYEVFGKAKVKARSIATMAIIIPLFALSACGQKAPEPIKLNKDNCSFCKMSISHVQFGAELITAKGRVEKFDDIHCMLAYMREKKTTAGDRFFVSDYSAPHALLPTKNLIFVKSESIKSPMGGGIAAFGNKTEAEVLQKEKKGEILTWEELIK